MRPKPLPSRVPRPTRLAATLVVALASLLPVLPLSGQDPGQPRTSAREAHAGIIEFMNAPTTLRLFGTASIPTEARVEGDLGILGGDLVLAGVIGGNLVVVNGDLRLEPGARVEGNVTVVGGALRGGAGEPWLGGALRLEATPLRYRIRGDLIEAEPVASPELPSLLVAELGFAQVRPILRSAGSYNRTEGLPVELGVRMETRSRNPLGIEGAAIWRSASGLELERENVGFRMRISQEMGGRGEARVHFSLHDVIRPIESRGMSDLESSLSTFLLRRDLRDHYQARGWSLRFEGSPLRNPVRSWLEYREEEHGFAPVRDPWTLRSGEREWRLQPLVAEGSLRTLEAGTILDTRDDPLDPATGWWVDVRLRRRVGGSASLPEASSTEATPFELATDGHLDMRRYNRLGPRARLNLQLLLAGPLDGSALPPQHQRALGGEGTLPGHPRFALDCGARSAAVPLPGGEGANDAPEFAYPAYGCDGVALARAEFQGPLPFSWRPGSGDWEMNSLLALRPAWTLFAGVGRGWSYASAGGDDTIPRVDAPTRADMGLGVFVGPLGIYWSWPLNRRDQGVNFFVRLIHRF
jgi:hypothetical protein